MEPRVLIVSHLYPSALRPMDCPWLAEQVIALAEAGVSVEVLCCSPYERDHEALVHTARGDVPIHYRSTTAGKLNGTHLGLIISAAKYARRARTFLRGGRAGGFDVLHAHFAFPDGFVGVRLGKRLRIPVVVTLHGSDVARIIARPGAIRALIRRVLSRASMIIGVSRGLEQAIRMLMPAARSTVAIPNGYDDRLFNLPTGDTVRDLGFLFVGALVPVKNPTALIETYLANADLQSLPLTIVGDGFLRESLENLVASSPAAGRVRFLGSFPRESVADVMRRAQALLMPSMREGFGVVAAEALACGTPVIASRVGAAEDLLADDRAGILFDPGDDVAMANAMRRVMAWPYGPADVAAASGAKRWSVRAEEIAAVYRALVTGAESPPQRTLAYLCLQATTEGQASHAHVHEVIEGLRALDWTVDLFEPSYAGGLAPGIVGRLYEFARVQHRLVVALRSGKYRALYVRGHALAWPASMSAAHLGIPVIQECNGPYSDFYAVWRIARRVAPLIEYLTRSQFSRADAVIAVTAELARWIEAETGRRASVIGTGANESLFVPADACGSPVEGLPEQYVVFFGSFAPWQEIPVLLAAVEHVSWPTDVSLVLVGDGPLNDEVARAASRNPRVIRLGPLPYSEVGRVVARSLCSMVLKSESYQTGPSPVKLYESMSCGVPVIATDIPGVRSVVADHDCGILLEHNTPSLVAAAVARIAARPDEAEQMGARGRAAVMRHYSWRARAFATAGVVAAAIDAAGPETIPATSSAL